MPIDAYWNSIYGPPGPNLLYNPPWIMYTDSVNTGDAVTPGSSNNADWSDSASAAPYFDGVQFTSMSGDTITMLVDCTVIIYLQGGLTTSADAVGNVTWWIRPSSFDTFLDRVGTTAIADIRPTDYTLGGFAFETLTLPPTRVLAGDEFLLTMHVNLDAGSAEFAANRLTFVRVA